MQMPASVEGELISCFNVSNLSPHTLMHAMHYDSVLRSHVYIYLILLSLQYYDCTHSMSCWVKIYFVTSMLLTLN